MSSPIIIISHPPGSAMAAIDVATTNSFTSVTLPDGTILQFPDGMSISQIASYLTAAADYLNS